MRPAAGADRTLELPAFTLLLYRLDVFVLKASEEYSKGQASA